MRAQEDLGNIPVKKDLIKEEFTTYEQLRDRTMALIAAQRKAIKGGLAMDTSIDRLSSNTPYHQTSQGSQEAPRTMVATAYPVQLTRTQEPVRFNGH
ncbi:MAG: hypothetical protein GY696_20045 [Gammaproteobacteria bacterium]|nr:hypothetical protein [Gammaproteobacteria bacterium]